MIVENVDLRYYELELRRIPKREKPPLRCQKLKMQDDTEPCVSSEREARNKRREG